MLWRPPYSNQTYKECTINRPELVHLHCIRSEVKGVWLKEMELFRLFHSTNNIPVNCLVKCKDKQKIEESVGEGIKALATVMLG